MSKLNVVDRQKHLAFLRAVYDQWRVEKAEINDVIDALDRYMKTFESKETK